MSELADKVCVPWRGGVPALSPEESQAFAGRVSGGAVVENHHLEKGFAFPNFAAALRFVNAVGAISEEQRHHPEIHFGWGRARLMIWTRKINGLTESDFVLAAKIAKLST